MAVERQFEPLHVTLRDGRSVHLRGMRADDTDELLQAFGRLSSQARYMRFMRAVGSLDPVQLRHWVAQLQERGLGIVATVPADDGIDIVGGASFVIGPDPQVCEFAITVVDDWEGVGLGGLLMRKLIEAARQGGLRWMEGYVLATNQPMLRLAKRLGFDSRPDHGDFGVRVVRLQLQP
jgi:RimJ/RimL family protein N-acetyltransferase